MSTCVILEITVAYAFQSQIYIKIYFFHESCLLFFKALIFRALILSKELLSSPFYSWRPETWKHPYRTSLALNRPYQPCAPAPRPSGATWLMSTCRTLPPRKKKNGWLHPNSLLRTMLGLCYSPKLCLSIIWESFRCPSPDLCHQAWWWLDRIDQRQPHSCCTWFNGTVTTTQTPRESRIWGI